MSLMSERATKKSEINALIDTNVDKPILISERMCHLSCTIELD